MISDTYIFMLCKSEKIAEPLINSNFQKSDFLRVHLSLGKGNSGGFQKITEKIPCPPIAKMGRNFRHLRKKFMTHGV